MTREAVDSGTRGEVQSRKPHEITFIYIPFPSGTLAICSDDRSQTFTDPDLGSLTFLPGGIGTVENLNENTTGQAERATLTLSGCDADLIATVVGDATHWLQVCIWLGYLGADGVLVSSPPYKLFDGFLGSPTLQTGANTSALVITAETLNVALARVSQVRGCDADQQLRFSTDTLFHQVSVQGKRVVVMGNSRGGGNEGARQPGNPNFDLPTGIGGPVIGHQPDPFAPVFPV